MINDEIVNMKISELAAICDEYSAQVYGRYTTSLPRTNITKGKLYKPYRNLFDLLYKIDMLEPAPMRLFIRVQYEMLWRASNWKGKAIPVNVMGSKFAIDRLINFIEAKTEKFGKSRISKYLDNFAEAPLIKDENCF